MGALQDIYLKELGSILFESGEMLHLRPFKKPERIMPPRESKGTSWILDDVVVETGLKVTEPRMAGGWDR